MINIGLHPSSTGKPGGDIVGQHMSDYPVENGRFSKACQSLVRNKAFRLPWIYRLSLPTGITLESSSDIEITENTNAPTNSEPYLTSPSQDFTLLDTSPLNPEIFLHSTYSDVLPEGSFISPPIRKVSKIKYQCPVCAVGVWGKPGIHLICGDCKTELRELHQ